MNSPPPLLAQLEQLHQTYCRLTGQTLSWRFDRERLWFEFLHAGFTLADLTQVVRYLQREIRHTRRNVGALKLSNLLQLDRFEEDLNISRVRLRPEAPPPPPALPSPTCSPAEQERGRQRALAQLRQIKDQLCQGPPEPVAHAPHQHLTLVLMELEPAVLENLQDAYRLVAEALGRAPQLHDCHLDQALLVLVLAMKRARRSPKLRYPRRPDFREPDLPF